MLTRSSLSLGLVVENLSRNRQAYPQLEAIYFLAPEEDSVDRFTRDFETRPLYAAAHLFFSNGTHASSDSETRRLDVFLFVYSSD